MKLQSDIITYITNVVDTAKAANIENLVLEEGRIRGMDEQQTVVLLQNHNVPVFPFDSMGFVNVPLVSNRFNIFFDLLKKESERAGQTSKDSIEFIVNIDIDEERGFVKSMNMKAGRLKIGTRCANSVHVKAPRIIHDTVATTLEIRNNMIDILGNANNAMGNVEEVTIHTVDDGIAFTVEDETGENFIYRFSDVSDIKVNYKYPLKLLLTLLKQNDSEEFGIGEKGIIRLIINDLDIFLLPRN